VRPELLRGKSNFVLYLLNAEALQILVGMGLVPLVAQAIIVPFAAVFSFFMISRALTGKFPAFGR
jgi:hypothetical protein